MTGRGEAGWMSALACLAALGAGQGARAEESIQKPHPVDVALKASSTARAAYARIKDYQCILIKRETLNGVLGANQIIEMKVRTKPYHVHMKWLEPKPMATQELCWVEGKNNGKMRARPAGLLGAIGFVSISPTDPRCLKTSNHPVTESGIGNLIEICHKGWTLERTLPEGATQVKVGTFLYAKRRCTRVELTHPDPLGGKLRHYRNVLYFDQATGLPIRNENYGWPKKAGDRPPLLEVFSYVNMRLDVGHKDAVFDK